MVLPLTLTSINNLTTKGYVMSELKNMGYGIDDFVAAKNEIASFTSITHPALI